VEPYTLTLIRGAHIYAPEDLGVGDLLLGYGKVLQVTSRVDVSGLGGLGEAKVIPADGLVAIPGLVDLHLHFMGGAGALGPDDRTLELSAEDILGQGVTSAVGLLGSDPVTRLLPSLYGKALALERAGITTFIYAGGFAYPSPTLTGSVRSDLMLIDKIVGVKLAVAEAMASSPTVEELARLANDVYAGGRLSGKAGLLHLHLGRDADPFPFLEAVLARSGVPPTTLLLCHVTYSASLFDGARRFVNHGTYLAVDSTLGPALEREGTVAPSVAIPGLLEAGVAPNRLILQSDANGYRTAVLESLLATVRELVDERGMPLAEALRFATTNPAAALKLAGRKGALVPGADADVVLLAQDFAREYVFTAGQQRIPKTARPRA
jgi:beta-aspartyl-dipeptidase (metallo-type)